MKTKVQELLEQAKELESSDIKQAVELYKKALEDGLSEADCVTVYCTLCKLYRKLNRYSDMQTIAEQGLLEYQNQQELMIHLAVATQAQLDYREALVIWRDLHQLDPKNRLVWINKVKCLQQLSCFEEAERLLKAAIELFPKDRELHILFARNTQQLRKWGEALRLWEVIENKFPDFENAKIQQANIFFELNMFKKAGDIFLKLNQENPESIPALKGIARVEESLGELNNACLTTHKIYKLSPELSVKRKIIALEVRLGNFEKVKEYCQSPELDRTDALDGMLQVAFLQKDYLEAKRLIEIARNEFPNNISFLMTQANLYLQLSDALQAKETYTTILAKHPKQSSAYLGLARAYMLEEDYGSAWQQCQRALYFDSESLVTYTLLVEILTKQGNSLEARAVIKEMKLLNPNALQTHLSVAKLLFHQLKIKQALVEWQTLAEIFPNEQQVINGMTMVLLYIYKKNDAIDFLNKVLNSFSYRKSYVITMLAHIAIEYSEWETALGYYEELLDFSKNEHLAYTGKAMCLFQLGKFQEAENWTLLTLEKFEYLPVVVERLSKVASFSEKVTNALQSKNIQGKASGLKNFLKKDGDYSFQPVRFKDAKEQIDVVYTWMNANDPVWQKLHSEFSEVNYREDNNRTRGKERYDSNYEIFLSLQLLEKNLSCLGNIYIVTPNQQFELDGLSPNLKERITFINQDTLFSEDIELPNFNSTIVESFLWRIPDLSECFLYLNDDMFLGRRVDFSDIIDTDGVAKCYLKPESTKPKPEQINELSDPEVDVKHTTPLQARNSFFDVFDVEPNLRDTHQFIILHKQACKDTYTIFRESWKDGFLKERFRGKKSVQFHLLSNYIGIYKGYQKLGDCYMFLKDSFWIYRGLTDENVRLLLEKKPKFFCLNMISDQVLYNKILDEYICEYMSD